MGRSDWEAAIEKNYLTTSPACGVAPSEGKHPFYLANYQRFFPQHLDAPILDIGIGSGDLLLLWKKHGFTDVWGLDINSEPIKICQREFPEYRICQVSSAAEFLWDHPQTFSLITMFDVLEHLKKEEMFDILRAAKAALRPVGTLLVQTINAANPFQIAGRYLDITHEQSFTELSLKQAFRLAKFEDLEIGPVETTLPSSFRRRIKLLLRSVYHRTWLFACRLDDGDQFEVLTPLIWVAAHRG